MRPQPTLRAAFRSALSASRGQSCASWQSLVASPFPQTAASASRIAATHSFSTSTRSSQDNKSASSSSTASASSSTSTDSAPVLPVSALSQILFSSTTSTPLVGPASTSVSSANPSVYATVQIHGRPYLVTPGDSVRLPFKMPGVQPGDELLLNRVGVVGNRTVTAVAGAGAGTSKVGEESFDVPYVPGATVKAVVLGVETEPLRTLVVKKRRTRRKRTVKSKHHYTVLRIQEVSVEA
ncbi:hypothetical protein Sste5346_004401 [Sporothrix stenoceras]|uniref:Large ribosomal subunit protein bL21m n=1 Tax=Sporothrix stenoceras TaxID=5173 RepID=A0ABR3Z7Y0_9PEZI